VRPTLSIINECVSKDAIVSNVKISLELSLDSIDASVTNTTEPRNILRMVFQEAHLWFLWLVSHKESLSVVSNKTST
jgi:hypothetical protein